MEIKKRSLRGRIEHFRRSQNQEMTVGKAVGLLIAADGIIEELENRLRISGYALGMIQWQNQETWSQQVAQKAFSATEIDTPQEVALENP